MTRGPKQQTLAQIMEEMIEAIAKTPVYSLGPLGDGWLKKADIAACYPYSRNSFYTHFNKVIDFFEVVRQGPAIYCRISTTVDWEDEVYKCSPEMSWELVAMTMREAIALDATLQKMEENIRHSGLFTQYAGVCRDLVEITHESYNTLGRIRNLLKKIEVNR